MDYSDVTPIETHSCSLWLVKFSSGREHLTAWHKDTTIEEVVRQTKVYYPEVDFTITRMDVGEWVITRVINSYSGDARGVNQDLEVVV